MSINDMIEERRKLLGPSEVTRKTPAWIAGRADRLIRNSGKGFVYGENGHGKMMAVFDLASAGRVYLDHPGTARFAGDPEAFVFEPYHISADHSQRSKWVAGALECHCTISANSWHYPGETVRVAFWRGLCGTLA